MSSSFGRAALFFRMDAPSSPAHVAAAARLIDEMLKSIAPNLTDADVTMVVSNFAHESAVRPRSKESSDALRLVVKFLDNPSKTAKRHPEVRDLARVLKQRGPEFQSLGAVFSRPRGAQLAAMNEEFMDMMATVARQTARPKHSYQGLQILSPILRIGRPSENSKLNYARVIVDEIPVEIPVADDTLGDAYDAAKDRLLHIVDVMAAYRHRVTGAPEFDASVSRVLAVGRSIRPMSGPALLHALREHAPSLRRRDDESLTEEP